MGAGAPKENKNAEKWTLKEATKLFDDALKLSKEKKDNQYTYDFIGEIARDLDQYKEVFSYLSDKFPLLKNKHNRIISNCESNCFYNGKNSNIVPSLAIMNLKSNHGWTDRVDNTSKGDKISQPVSIKFKSGK